MERFESNYESIRKQLEGRDSQSLCVIDTLTGEKWLYGSFSQRTRALSKYLLDKNIRELIVREDNSFELCLLYFACAFSLTVIIPIDPEKESAEVEKIKEIHPEASFWDRGTIKEIAKELVWADEKTELCWRETDFDRLFLVTYTSGSTGEPKGVKHNLGNLLFSAKAFAQHLQYGEEVVMGHCMPMTYMAGILNTVFLPFLVGGVIAILPRFSMQNAFGFWGKVKETKINTLWLSPTMLRILNMTDKKAAMKEYFHENNMKISVGTAPLDIALRKDVEEKYDINLFQSYGLSETLFITSEIPGARSAYHTVGPLLPGVSVEFAEDKEIQLVVPWMFLGYTNADSSSYFDKDRYLTGDLGAFEGDSLIIIGRKKDLIVKGGYNINPSDIENCLIEEGLVSECAVVSADIKGEESIVCCVVPKDSFSEEVCNETIVRKNGKHCRVDIFERYSSLPKNLNGKLDKPKIREEVRGKYGSKS